MVHADSNGSNTLVVLQFYFAVTLNTCDVFATATVFTIKNTAEESMEGDGAVEEDDFQTDEDEGMEVDKQVVQKRKKVSIGSV